MPTPQPNRRELEDGIQRNLAGRTTYASYLHLDTLLAAQHTLSDPPCHDELLFIVQHHVAELWMKLMIHELRGGIADLAADHAEHALAKLARIKRIQDQLFNEWAVLETMAPQDYLKFRHVFGPASGFQSQQYRMLEFLLGNKNADMLTVFKHNPEAHAALRETLDSPSLYDVVLAWLARRGHAIDAAVLQRDVRHAWKREPLLLPVFQAIYAAPDQHWPAFQLCEALVDIEENFQLWRFRHMKAVERIIGHRQGTGGSSGVGFLKKALDLTFFPELLEVRTQLSQA